MNTPSHIHAPLTQEAVLIIGAGYFGKRAARILNQKPDTPIFFVDKDEQRLVEIEDPSIEKILCDGINFLVQNFPFLSPSNTIIPVVPLYLAFAWLKTYLYNDFRIKQIEVPGELKPFLLHTWP